MIGTHVLPEGWANAEAAATQLLIGAGILLLVCVCFVVWLGWFRRP